MIEKYIKYNSTCSKVLSCDQRKAGVVTLKNEVTVICESAFQDCHDIREIIFPPQLECIEANAFKDCYHLTEITIPTSVKEIGKSAFSHMENIKRKKPQVTAC